MQGSLSCFFLVIPHINCVLFHPLQIPLNNRFRHPIFSGQRSPQAFSVKPRFQLHGVKDQQREARALKTTKGRRKLRAGEIQDEHQGPDSGQME